MIASQSVNMERQWTSSMNHVQVQSGTQPVLVTVSFVRLFAAISTALLFQPFGHISDSTFIPSVVGGREGGR